MPNLEICEQGKILKLQTIPGMLTYNKQNRLVHLDEDSSHLSISEGMLLSSLIKAEGRRIRSNALLPEKRTPSAITNLIQNLQEKTNPINLTQEKLILNGEGTYYLNTSLPTQEELRISHEAVHKAETPFGRLVLYPERYVVVSPLNAQKSISLTETELKFLEIIMRNPNTITQWEDILQFVYQRTVLIEHDLQMIQQVLYRIRTKLGESGQYRRGSDNRHILLTQKNKGVSINHTEDDFTENKRNNR